MNRFYNVLMKWVFFKRTMKKKSQPSNREHHCQTFSFVLVVVVVVFHFFKCSSQDLLIETIFPALVLQFRKLKNFSCLHIGISVQNDDILMMIIAC